MDIQMYIEDLKSSVDSLDKKCKEYEKQIAELKSYLTSLDLNSSDTVSYWDDSLKSRKFDMITHMEFIMAYTLYNHINSIVKTCFDILHDEAYKPD